MISRLKERHGSGYYTVGESAICIVEKMGGYVVTLNDGSTIFFEHKNVTVS